MLEHGHFVSHNRSEGGNQSAGYFNTPHPVATGHPAHSLAGARGATATQVTDFKREFATLLTGCIPQADATLSGRGAATDMSGLVKFATVMINLSIL